MIGKRFAILLNQSASQNTCEHKCCGYTDRCDSSTHKAWSTVQVIMVMFSPTSGTLWPAHWQLNTHVSNYSGNAFRSPAMMQIGVLVQPVLFIVLIRSFGSNVLRVCSRFFEVEWWIMELHLEG